MKEPVRDDTDASAQVTLDEGLAIRREEGQDIVAVDEPLVQLVVFTLGENTFAVPGQQVQEVLNGDETVYFVPGMPDAVEGVVNLRGDIESVLQLHALLKLPLPDPLTPGMILLAQAGGMRSGLRIDQLEDVRDVDPALLKTPPATLPPHLRPYVTALWERDGEAVALLDLETLFNAYRENGE